MPCHVQVRRGAGVVAEAIAQDFRRDLLLSNHGHGHYGFQARLRQTLPTGPSMLVLHLPALGLGVPMAIVVPDLRPPKRASVEALLRTPSGWTVSDLLARPTCLDMQGSHSALGTPRFVDAVFRFVLRRWPSPAEARLHAANLQANRVAPQALLVELLTGRERADMEGELLSPYDPEFPFIDAGHR
jgi:hypothetical protein